MGQCSSTPSSEDVGAGFASAFGVLLTATKPVPVVGEVAKVLLEVAEKYGEISGTLDEAVQVRTWAFEQAKTFDELEKSTSDSSKEIDKVLRAQLREVARSIGELLKIAEKIKKGCFLTRRIKAGTFQRQFNSAKNAVEGARVELDRTLTIKIADTVHRIEETADANSDKLDAILAKIEENGDANERQLQRGLVESVKHQPELLTVAEMVVDGDGAGASAALAEAPVEMRESAAALFAKGMALYQQESWSEAIVALKNCVARDPENSKAWFALGYAYHGQNGKKSCEAEFEPYTRCIALDPKNVPAHINLGLVLQYVRKDYDGAERHYRKAIDLDPTKAAAHCNLGGLLKEVREDYDGAERHYRKAIELNPSYAMAHNGLGCVLKDVRKYDGAERHYRKAIELDPEHAAAHVNLGSLLQTVRNNYDDAEKLYRKAIELDPKQTNARWNLSLILENQKNDIPGAIKLVEEYINCGGDRAKAERDLATLRAKLETTQ